MAKRIVLAMNLLILVGFVVLGLTRPSAGPWGVAAHWMITAMLAWGSWVIATERRPSRAVWLTVATAGFALLGIWIAVDGREQPLAAQLALVGSLLIGAVLFVTLARQHERT